MTGPAPPQAQFLCLCSWAVLGVRDKALLVVCEAGARLRVFFITSERPRPSVPLPHHRPEYCGHLGWSPLQSMPPTGYWHEHIVQFQLGIDNVNVSDPAGGGRLG